MKTAFRSLSFQQKKGKVRPGVANLLSFINIKYCFLIGWLSLAGCFVKTLFEGDLPFIFKNINGTGGLP